MDIEARRREAIACFAAMEQLSAHMLTQQAVAPEFRAALPWMEARLTDIERFFLAHADQCSGAAQERWLRAAERWLAFYTSEIRRLEDLVGIPHDVETWPRQ